jgi:trans-2,3-dihydro-3-hydroxyanthranilate isomerase
MARASLRYRIVNVFAEKATLSGNALAVFEDGDGVDDDTMQAIALQLNLSETTFVLPSDTATARVRIFTPSFEMPFAGHPTLGTAYVVSALRGGLGRVTLETKAGVVPVECQGETWTLNAKAPSWRDPESTRAQLAAMLGIAESDVSGPALWVDTGSDQLIVPLVSAAAVMRCSPDVGLLVRHASNASRQGFAYVWARRGDTVIARFFFLKHGSLVEDPGTGSACANLGGWHVATKAPLPVDLTVLQGEKTGRRCRLGLRVDTDRRIYVSGRVVEIGRGDLTL